MKIKTKKFNFKEYCVSSLQLSFLFNETTINTGFNYTAANASYPLSQAVRKRILDAKFILMFV